MTMVMAFIIQIFIAGSVTRWLDYFILLYDHLQHMKICLAAYKIGFKLLPNTRLSIENCQKTFNAFAKSGHTDMQ